MKNLYFKFSPKPLLFSVIASAFFSNIPQSIHAEKNLTQIMMQNNSISGTIIDTNNNPIIGATIRVKGSTTGIISDINGNFTLKNIPNNATLIISYIGYQSQEILLKGQTSLKIVLQEDNEMLDEVVVVGYGTMRKKDLTGSVIQLRPDNIALENPQSVQDVLRGTPGLSVGMATDAKGGGSLQIRGQRSLYTSGSHNDPLIILDGMMFYGELSEINPDDIGQIDVLKDASSAAVYGAKAANGVIIITTKKGLQGKPTIKFTSNIGFSTMGANRHVYDAEGYAQFYSDWYTATTYGINPETGKYEEYQTNKDKFPAGYYAFPTQANLDKYGITLEQWRGYTQQNADMSDNEIFGYRMGWQGTNLQNFLLGKTFDWYDHSFRTGLNQDYNASISGASESVNYYFSFGYLNNEGVVVGNDYRAFRSNMKLNANVTKWLEIGANINFQDRTDGDNAVDWGKQITKNSPFASYRNEAGDLEIYPMGNIAGNRGWNYDFDQQFTERESGYTVFNTILNAKVKLPFNISYTFNIAPRYQWFYKRTFNSSKHPDRTQGSATRNNGKRFDWALNNTLSWDYTFAQKHHIVLTLVQEAEERRKWSDDLSANNLAPTDALGFHFVKAADKESSSFSSDDSHETADGMLARLFYSYDDRYMFTGSIRRDGYSAFGTSNPRATFFSAAAAWTFSNEKFFKWETMSTGKLRLSWGENGNRSLANPYIALADLGAGMGATQGYIDANGNTIEYRYYTMNRLANRKLQWEKTTSWNIGLDFGFLNDRIKGSVDVYHMPTTDMIMNQSLPGFTGFGSITCNLGEVVNKGVEISLTTNNIQTNNLEWNTTIGFSYNKNRIKHLYYEYEPVFDATGNIISMKETDDISNGWFIGQPIGAIWNYKVIGIWQKDEAEEAKKYGQRPGDPKVWNNPANDKVNADGSTTIIYDNDDKVFMGQTSAPYNWSIRNEFILFKDLTFSFNLYSKMGHKSLSDAFLNKDNAGSKITNGENVYKKEYWTIDNPTNDYARLDAQGPSGVASPSKLYNRSFIRLENISLAYTLPKKLTSQWGIERVNISGSIRNVACWGMDSTWSYWDPETGGIAPRIFNIGLSLTL